MLNISRNTASPGTIYNIKELSGLWALWHDLIGRPSAHRALSLAGISAEQALNRRHDYLIRSNLIGWEFQSDFDILRGIISSQRGTISFACGAISITHGTISFAWDHSLPVREQFALRVGPFPSRAVTRVGV